MNILDIAIAKKLAGGGGGSGTDNYNDLSNLPKINDTTLSGNKSSSALGLQSEINSDSKLASDLVDDTNQDNKFVTSTEKNTWNAKQNAIDSDHKLSSSLVSFTTAEAAALASGIDSTKVGQISTNQTNILSVEDMVCATEFSSSTAYAVGDVVTYEHKLYKFINAHQGAWSASDVQNYDLTQLQSEDRAALAEVVDKGAKNLLDFANLVSLKTQNATVTKTDTTVTVTSNNTWGYQSYLLDLRAGKYELSFNATAVSISSGRMFVAVFPGQTAEGHIVQVDVTSTGSKHGSFEWTGGELNISFYANPSNVQIVNSMTITDVMICTEADWKISQNYTPYALPNADLTQLQQEDRNALVEVVDKGAKNKFDISTATFDNQGGQFSVTYNGDSATIKRISGSAILTTPNFSIKLDPGTYVLSGCPSTGSDSTYRLDLRDSIGTVISGSIDYGSGSSAFQISTTGTYRITMRFANNYTVPNEGITIIPMICTEADWKVSHAFVPYRKNLDELEATKAPALVLGLGVSSGSLDDVTKPTFDLYLDTVSNLPTIAAYYVETSVWDSKSMIQRAYNVGNAESYIRVKSMNTWSAWKQITNA